MGAIDWLVCRQTPEEELRLEVETREILNNENLWDWNRYSKYQ